MTNEVTHRRLKIEQPDTAERITVVLSTETPVQRVDKFGERYDEILSHAPGAVDLSRAPLPLIEAHDSKKLPVGRIENMRVEARKLRGEIVLSKSKRGQEIRQDIEDHILTAVSVGAEILKAKDSGNEITITHWRPFECSLVAVAADHNAGLNRGKDMETETRETEDLSRREKARLKDKDIEREQAIERERERRANVRSVFNRHPEQKELMQRCLDDPATDTNEARTRLLEVLGSGATPSGGCVRVDSHGGHENFVERAADAILARTGYGDRSKADQALVGTSTLDLARHCLNQENGYLGQSPDRLIRSALSTGDFPLILENALHKAMRQGSESEAGTHRRWVRQATVSDFRAQPRVILSSAPDLEEVAEYGEYTHGHMDEDKAAYSAQKFGKIIRLSFEALTNDDMGAFTRISAQMGQAAMRREADLVYDKLLANAGDGQDMQDSNPLFHSSHDNTVAALNGEMSGEALQLARAKMRRQKDISGRGWLNLTPRYLLVPPERESEAEIIIARSTLHQTDSTEAQTPGWIRSLVPVVEPRLEDANVTYLIASPDQVDTFELGTLPGHPFAEPEDSFNIDAVSWKIRHVFGGAFLDHRGIVRMTMTP